MCWYPAKYSRAGYLHTDTSWNTDKSLCRPLQRTVPRDKTVIANVISSLFVFSYPSCRVLYHILFMLNPAHPRSVFFPAIGQISISPEGCKYSARTIRPHRISITAYDAKKSTQRQNSVGLIQKDRSKQKVSWRKMHRHSFSTHEPKAEQKERKNLVVFSCAKIHFRKVKASL